MYIASLYNVLMKTKFWSTSPCEYKCFVFIDFEYICIVLCLLVVLFESVIQIYLIYGYMYFKHKTYNYYQQWGPTRFLSCFFCYKTAYCKIVIFFKCYLTVNLFFLTYGKLICILGVSLFSDSFIIATYR